MKKIAFTFAFVAVAAISASAHLPFQDPFGGWLKTGHLKEAEKTVAVVDKTTGAISVDKATGFDEML